MKTATKKLATKTAIQEVAHVARVDAEGIHVASAAGSYCAKRAASCLLAPERGDEVLVAVVTGGACYVTAVLERDAAAAAVIEVEGDLSIRSVRGRLSLAGPDGVDLISGAEANVVATDVNIRATRASVVLEELALLANSVLGEVKAARFVAETVDSVAGRLVQRVKQAYRVIEGADHLRAERIDYVADKDFCVRAQNTVLMAEELIKVDGAQIHVG